jgi:hypothetical protein
MMVGLRYQQLSDHYRESLVVRRIHGTPDRSGARRLNESPAA